MGVTSCPSPLVPNGERAPQAVKNRDRKSVGDDLTIKIAHAEKKGMMIGEMSLIDMKPRSATVRANSEVTMIVLEREALASLFDKDPKVLATISLNIARALSVRLRSANDMFSEFFSNSTA